MGGRLLPGLRRMTALYWYVPVGVVVLVVGSVVWRRLLPHRRDPFTVILVSGLPVAAVAFFVATGTVYDPQPDQYEQLPRGQHADLSLRLLIVAVELTLAWFVALRFVLLRWVPGALMGRPPRG